jgi:hypothetical protein
MERIVVCMKWGAAFESRDVNMLFRACREHCREPLRFICLTDDATGLAESVEAWTIPDIGLTDEEWKRPGVWPKLSLFSNELAKLGRILFLDLDMMVVGDLSPFFEPTEGVVFLNTGDSWRPVPRSPAREPGTGIFSYDPGAEQTVLDVFLANKQDAMTRWHNEQEFVGAHVSKFDYWSEGLVVSFKRHLCHRNGAGIFKKPLAPPKTTSVVAFHGTPRPRETMEKLIWGAPPHFHVGKAPWVSEYFHQFGAD